MPNLSIKNVPEAIVAMLRERATRHHRSLQGELMALVCEAVEQREPGVVQRRVTAGVRTGTKTVEEIAAQHRARRPQPFDQGPKSVDLIRADRDAR